MPELRETQFQVLPTGRLVHASPNGRHVGRRQNGSQGRPESTVFLATGSLGRPAARHRTALGRGKYDRKNEWGEAQEVHLALPAPQGLAIGTFRLPVLDAGCDDDAVEPGAALELGEAWRFPVLHPSEEVLERLVEPPECPPLDGDGAFSHFCHVPSAFRERLELIEAGDRLARHAVAVDASFERGVQPPPVPGVPRQQPADNRRCVCTSAMRSPPERRSGEGASTPFPRAVLSAGRRGKGIWHLRT